MSEKKEEVVETPVETPVRPRRNHKIIWIITGSIVVLIALGAVAGFELGKLFNQQSNNGLTSHQAPANDGNKIVTQQEGDIASVVEKVGPSVVSIITTESAGPEYGNGEAAQQEGAGTGIIVSGDGYILTNKHVISDAKTIKVVLSDGTTHENVKLVGTDPLNDVAFLKVDGVTNLPAAQLGDSSSTRIGQQVVAIGNSLGQYQNTVTSGIISGIGRPISAQAGNTVENLTDLLQTDAAINLGNSGGPLLNLSGQVIGINTAIVQDAQGIGFAIPINTTKGIMKGVLAGKGVTRAYLGVNFVTITADVAKYYNLGVKQGAYVHSERGAAVLAGSPADKAGIKDGDIITKIGGVDVGVGGSVSSLVAEYVPGDTIEVSVLRDGKTVTLQVTLAAYKA
ncbi:MAG TPA: trypsin-like peptidase domain-containing protein [Candidatus Saccharimonadales bacterium]|nr:trypsin-like peptidase domain-containing protein [Candidatus Saccharimonadales bacterium]